MLSLREALHVLGTSSVREAVESTGVRDSSVRRQIPRALAKHAIMGFHEKQLGILIVGSPVGPVRDAANGAHEQRFEFGSILKPLDLPPRVATRFIVTIEIAAIKCFGTDDPDGEDQPYLVTAVYGIDPLQQGGSVRTSKIHFGNQTEGSVFRPPAGKPLMSEPIFIPGNGSIQVTLSLWDEEVASPGALQDKWRGIASAAIIAGLALLNPMVGSGASVLEAAEGIVKDAARELVTAVSEFLGIADDHIATRSFPITADFLKRLIAHGSGMPRTSASIPGIPYNFPELPETDDPVGRSWLFEGAGGSYRIFLTVRAAEVEVNLSPPLG
jgi:hypothetical protein